MWVDQQGNWHIINHAYSNMEYTNCGVSAASAHFFSPDGRVWNYSAQPCVRKARRAARRRRAQPRVSTPHLHTL